MGYNMASATLISLCLTTHATTCNRKFFILVRFGRRSTTGSMPSSQTQGFQAVFFTSFPVLRAERWGCYRSSPASLWSLSPFPLYDYSWMSKVLNLSLPWLLEEKRDYCASFSWNSTIKHSPVPLLKYKPAQSFWRTNIIWNASGKQDRHG